MSDKITDLAQAMQMAYKNKRTQGEAVDHVRSIYHDADLNILWAMWAAIDAYCEINHS